jgi:lysophospholipid acyltransferase (LPLAT)-like uncharacterized protein
MKKFKKSFRDIKKLPTWFFFPIAFALKFSKMFLMRTSIVDPHHSLDVENIPVITVTWHNRLLYFPALLPKKYRVRTYALISPSRDGQYVSDLVHHFGVGSVRGSSSKKGARALKEAEKVINNKFNLSVTPDGPRGPKYKMSQGPIILASKTGRPILPISINASRYWEVKSWDKFQIAKPGAKIEAVFGDLIKIPPELSAEEIERWKLLVEDKLLKITCEK